MGRRAGKHKLGARAGEYYLEARVGKYKLWVRAGKDKLGARSRTEGQAKGRGPGNKNILTTGHLKIVQNI